MLSQLLLGTVVVCVTAYIHAFVLAGVIEISPPVLRWVRRHRTVFRVASGLAFSVIWIMLGHVVEAGVWAVVFVSLGLFESTSTAYYFALVAYTTLGFGDITLPEEWRILSGFAAANGFLVFGWSTAFQVEYLSNMRPLKDIDSEAA